MSIASEITALNTNLTAAKNAVTAKGGTVGDTGLAGLANEIASIPAGGGGSEPAGEGVITGYNTTTGVISGYGFGSTAGTVYLLDRATHTYIQQPHSAWSPTSITLTTPVDLSTIEGTTSLVAVLNDGTWSTKQLITGQIAVSGYAKAYVKDFDTGNVRTVAIASGEWSQFAPSNNRFSVQITCGGDTFYADEVVGVQFGSSFDLTTLTGRTLAFFVNLNQPVVIPEGVTTINFNFMAYCYSFNQPLILPSTITSMNGGNFLYYCYAFNQPLTVPYGVEDIGSYFLSFCYAFNQKITLPTTMTTINTNFLGYAVAYNKEIVIPEGVTSIKNNFMNYCYAFDKNVSLPSTLTSIGDAFFYNAFVFNQPLIIPNTVTSIGNNFMARAYTFNQPLTLSTSLTTIGGSFLSESGSFNQPLTLPSTLTTIGEAFLSYCTSFAQHLTIPSSVTSIGVNFMQNCYAFSHITVNNATSPTDNPSLGVNYNYTKAYVKGRTIDGTGVSTWTSNLPNRTSNPFRKFIV